MAEITSIGALRKAIEGLPDDRMILFQVAATDGSAWNMHGGFMPLIGDSFALISLRHPELATLKDKWP